MLAPGSPLPPLACPACLPDGRIEPVELAAYRGRWLVLLFWPYDFARQAAAELRDYAELAGDFELSGAALLGASVDSAYAHQAWTRLGLGAARFPLLGDSRRELATACGVLGADGVAVSACYIATPEGRIAGVSACDPVARRSARDTLRQLHALQSGELAASAWTPTSIDLAA